MINQLAWHISKNTGKRYKRYKRDNAASAFSDTRPLLPGEELKRASNNARAITRLHPMTVNIYVEDLVVRSRGKNAENSGRVFSTVGGVILSRWYTEDITGAASL